MKELSKYQCEYCNTEYNDKSKAEQCENNHKVKTRLKDKRYLPYSQDKSGYPLVLNVEFEDGKVITYKRS